MSFLHRAGSIGAACRSEPAAKLARAERDGNRLPSRAPAPASVFR